MISLVHPVMTSCSCKLFTFQCSLCIIITYSIHFQHYCTCWRIFMSINARLLQPVWPNKVCLDKIFKHNLVKSYLFSLWFLMLFKFCFRFHLFLWQSDIIDCSLGFPLRTAHHSCIHSYTQSPIKLPTHTSYVHCKYDNIQLYQLYLFQNHVKMKRKENNPDWYECENVTRKRIN